MAASRRGDFATLTHRGRQKVKMGGGDQELASLEKNIYGVPRVIEEEIGRASCRERV